MAKVFADRFALVLAPSNQVIESYTIQSFSYSSNTYAKMVGSMTKDYRSAGWTNSNFMYEFTINFLLAIGVKNSVPNFRKIPWDTGDYNIIARVVQDITNQTSSKYFLFTGCKLVQDEMSATSEGEEVVLPRSFIAVDMEETN
jgi:hypothetical protein